MILVLQDVFNEFGFRSTCSPFLYLLKCLAFRPFYEICIVIFNKQNQTLDGILHLDDRKCLSCRKITPVFVQSRGIELDELIRETTRAIYGLTIKQIKFIGYLAITYDPLSSS